MTGNIVCILQNIYLAPTSTRFYDSTSIRIIPSVSVITSRYKKYVVLLIARVTSEVTLNLDTLDKLRVQRQEFKDASQINKGILMSKSGKEISKYSIYRDIIYIYSLQSVSHCPQCGIIKFILWYPVFGQVKFYFPILAAVKN